MSIIARLVRRLATPVVTRDRVATNPDTMSLRDWADLPPHHPLVERTPC